MHHHRGEVGDVEHPVAGHVQRHALVLAQLRVLPGERLGVLAAAWVEDLRPGQVDAQFIRASLHGLGVAEDRQVGDIPAQQPAGGVEDPVVVALRQHDVPLVRAGALEELVLEHLRRHDVGGVHTQAGEQFLGVDVLLHEAQCRLDLAPGAGVHASPGLGRQAGGVVGAVVGAHDRQRRAHATDQSIHRRVRHQAPVPDHPRQRGEALRAVRGEDSENGVGPVSGNDDDHAVHQPLQDPLTGHPAHHQCHDLSVQQGRVTGVEGAVHGIHQLPHRGRGEQGLARQRPGGQVQGRELGLDCLQRAGVAPVDHDPHRVRVLDPELLERQPGVRADLPWCPVGAADHQEHGRAEVHGECGVEVELGGTGHARVVGAEDHHHIALPGHHVVPVHDLRQRRVAVLVDAVVGHADAVLVVEVHGGVLEQHLHDAVARGFGVRAGAGIGIGIDDARRDGDRAEHPHPLYGPGENAQEAEGDGRLPGVALGGRHVHSGRRQGHVGHRGRNRGRVGLGRESLGYGGIGHEGIVTARARRHTSYTPCRPVARPDARPRRRDAGRG